MGSLDDLIDDATQYSSEAQRLLERAESEVVRRDQSLDQAQDSLEILSTRQMAQLYKEEDIPYEAAVEFEEMIDQMRVGAGLPMYFDNLPDDQRPSEMYKKEEFWTSRRKLIVGSVALITGAGVVGSDAGNYAEEDTQDRGGIKLPFGPGDIDAWGHLESHRAAEGSSSRSGSRVIQHTVEETERIGSYLDDEVRGDEFLSAERNWGDLLSTYDSIQESDRSIESLEIVLNEDPGEYSTYGVSMEIDGQTEFDTRVLKDDKAAENALEYFEVI